MKETLIVYTSSKERKIVNKSCVGEKEIKQNAKNFKQTIN